MEPNSRTHRLEDKVRSWIQQQSPSLHFVEDEAGGNPDFLILRPIPVAMITMDLLSPAQSRRKAKRLLAQRIELAERFGAHLPVVVVVPEDTEPDWVNFADKVFGVRALPPYAELVAGLQLNPEVAKILKDGMPGEVTFSTGPDILEKWEHSLCLDDLGNDDPMFPRDSLAQRLSEALLPFKNPSQYLEPEQQRTMPSGRSRDYSDPAQPGVKRIELPWYLGARCSEAIDREIFKFIDQRCGGHVESKRQHGRLLEGQVVRNVWVSDEGTRVVIRRQSIGDTTVAHKVNELIAEAWMTRALLRPKANKQVLLLTMGREPSQTSNSKKMRAPRLFDVNELEAAGWLVAPWDFASPEPCFMKLLKEVGHD